MLEINSSLSELSSLFCEHMSEIIDKLVIAKFFDSISNTVMAFVNFA